MSPFSLFSRELPQFLNRVCAAFATIEVDGYWPRGGAPVEKRRENGRFRAPE
jgi:hypothetical protein